jgi:hypothetical protein
LKIGGTVVTLEDAVLFTGFIQKQIYTETGFERNWAALTGQYKNGDTVESVFTFL